MKLTFHSVYLSLDQFSPVEIPDFTVLTGENGSGKSHLLQAIEKRYVTVEEMKKPHIVLFNYETFRLDNEPVLNAQQLSQERAAAWQYYQQNVKGTVQNLRVGLGDTYQQIAEMCKRENRSFWESIPEPFSQNKQQLANFFNQEQIRSNQQAPGLFSLVKQLPFCLDEIEEQDFFRRYKPFTFKNDFLPNQLGKVFWDYYIKFRNNQVNQFQNEKYGKQYEALSEEDFFAAHGEPPWNVVNKILKTFDTLKYEVPSPEGLDYFANFQLKLKHIEKPDLEIDFDKLSSGERVLMALVASVYKSSADKHFPDLLLLDEVDASLHPSMMKNMLDVIERIFLKQNVRVILITHSPTTLALAPEDSIFVMNRAGFNRIEKKSKQEALSILTQGFATIEQGLRLFDQVALERLTVITEGKNTDYIRRALAFSDVGGINVLNGIEGSSGKDQLKTLFQFFTKVQHTNKVLFVWDCDVSFNLSAQNNTFPFILPKNEKNQIATRGIENAFPEIIFQGFIKTTTSSTGVRTDEFDETRKKDFLQHVIARNERSDFGHFAALIAEINRIKALP